MRPGRDLLPLLLATLLVGALTLVAGADVVYLHDGSKIEGKIRRDGTGWLITDASGKQTRVGDDQIKLIEKSSSLTPAEAVEGKLASLRRSTDALNDAAAAIDRYNKFIEQNKGTPLAAEAQKDLEQWKDRQARGLVKVGGKWVTAEEQAAMLAKVAESVAKVREMVKASRLRDADAAVDQLLATDPKNPAGLYLKGVLAFRQDQSPNARKAWEQVRELVADHGPTLNNLAVLQAKLKQPLGAVALYDLAMAAMPGNRQILDNAAEALAAVPEKQRNQQSYIKALKRFEEQDAELQKKMAEQGLFRWGSTYVSADQMEQVKKAQEKVKEKLDQLASDYERLTDREAEIERQVQINEKSLQRIRNDSVIRDSTTGQSTQLRLPSIYYDIKREQDRLGAELKEVWAKKDTFKEKELRIKQEVPVPQFTGTQRIIDVEGTPLTAGGAKKGAEAPVPTTQPGGKR